MSTQFPEHTPEVAGPELPDSPQLSPSSRLTSSRPSGYSGAGYSPAQYPSNDLDLEALLTSDISSLAKASQLARYQTQSVQALASGSLPVPSAAIPQTAPQSTSSLGLFAYLARERAIAAAAAQPVQYPLADALVASRRAAIAPQPEAPAAAPTFAGATNVAASPASSGEPVAVTAATTVAQASTQASDLAAVSPSAPQAPTALTSPTAAVSPTPDLPAVPAVAASSVAVAAMVDPSDPAMTATLPTVAVADTATPVVQPVAEPMPMAEPVPAAEPTPPTATSAVEQTIEAAAATVATESVELAVVLPANSDGDLFSALPEAAVEPIRMAAQVSSEMLEGSDMKAESPVSTALMQTVVMRQRIFARLCAEARERVNTESMPAFCADETKVLAQRIPDAATAGTPIPGKVLSPTRSNP